MFEKVALEVQSNLVNLNLGNEKNLDYANFFPWRDFLISDKRGFLRLFLKENLDNVKILSLVD